MSDQNEIADAVRRVLDKQVTSPGLRAVLDTESGFDQRLWNAVTDIGLTGIHVPEAYGGLGLPFSQLAVVLQELGRRATPLPFFSSVVLGATALMHCNNEAARREFLPLLASGKKRASVAVTGSSGRLSDVGLQVRQDDSGFHVHGVAQFVLDAHTCDFIILCARSHGAGLVFLIAHRSELGDAVRWTPTVDQTRRLCRIEIDDLLLAPERVLCMATEADALLAKLIEVGALGLASDCLGGAEMVLEMTTSYAKQRVQFERPIGSFQAIKHKCADLLLLVEGTRVAVEHAADCTRIGGPAATELPSMAKAYAGETYVKATGDCMQMHGGIGFTWDHDMHIFFKRAALNQQLFGSSHWHRERVAQSMLRELDQKLSDVQRDSDTASEERTRT